TWGSTPAKVLGVRRECRLSRGINPCNQDGHPHHENAGGGSIHVNSSMAKDLGDQSFCFQYSCVEILGPSHGISSF
ncbi:hypothetical protein, partial [Moorena sp. SIO4A5]|uniref:hypothetical protein n=1 Tax=Moorena sp. SIO4A5 TaxID=2607838 RepID=UPI0025EEB541